MCKIDRTLIAKLDQIFDRTLITKLDQIIFKNVLSTFKTPVSPFFQRHIMIPCRKKMPVTMNSSNRIIRHVVNPLNSHSIVLYLMGITLAPIRLL